VRFISVLDTAILKDMLLSVQSLLRLLAIGSVALFATSAAAVAQDSAAPATHGADAIFAPRSAQDDSSRARGVDVLTPIPGIDLSGYAAAQLKKIDSAWHATVTRAAPLPQKNRVMSVTFWIKPDGHVEDAVIGDSSGVEAFDRVGLEAVNNASPLDPLPSGVGSRRAQFRITFGFTLEFDANTKARKAFCDNADRPLTVGSAFDRLDTLALLAGNIDGEAARGLLCARGINFTPDAGFKETLTHYQRAYHWENLVFALTAKTVIDPPADRVQAYQLLTVNPSLPDHAPNVPDADLLAKALELVPDSGPLNLAVARTEFAAKNFAAAETHAKQAVKVWRESSEAEQVIAGAQLSVGKYSDVLAAAREAVRLAPSSLAAQFVLGSVLVATGQFKEAVALLAVAQRHGSRNPEISHVYGIALLRSGDALGAIEPLQRYLEVKRNDAYAHYLLGVAYRELGRKPEAIEQFDKAGLLSPTSQLFAFVRDRMNESADAAVGLSAATQTKLRAGAAVNGNTYTNPFLGFSYTFPSGWHVLPPAACMNPTTSIFFPEGSSDPVRQDMGLLGESIGTLLLCASRDHEQELKMDSPSIRVMAFDSNAAAETLRADSVVRGTAKLGEAEVAARGGVMSAPEAVVIGGMNFTKLTMQAGPGTTALREMLAAADLNGYVVMFDLDAIDRVTAAQLTQTLESLKFPKAVVTVRPAN